jgi:DNA-binding MarR family transcriptional regulator
MTSLSNGANLVKGLTNGQMWPRPIGDLLRMAHQRLVSHLDSALTEAGWTDVTVPQVSVLATIDRHGSRLTTLVERGGRTKQATAELAGQLVMTGYLALGPDPSDGRAKLYTPTDRGLTLLAACARVVHDYETWLDGVVGSDAIVQLRHTLTVILSTTSKSLPSASRSTKPIHKNTNGPM